MNIIRSYYSVLVGWCGYYFIQMCASTLPSSVDNSQQIWDSLQVALPHSHFHSSLSLSHQGSNWPVLCHGVAILLASLAVSRGVSTIEPVNKVSLLPSPLHNLSLLNFTGDCAHFALHCCAVFLLGYISTLRWQWNCPPVFAILGYDLTCTPFTLCVPDSLSRESQRLNAVD